MDFFIWFLIAKFQGLEYLIFRFSQGASIVGEDQGFWFGNRGDRDFLSIEDLLGMRGARGWLGSVGGSAALGIMSNLSTFKTPALSHTLCMFLWSELFQLHEVYFHGVGVSGDSGCG